MIIAGLYESEGGINLISAAWQCAVMTTAAVGASRNFFTLLSPFCWAHSEPWLSHRWDEPEITVDNIGDSLPSRPSTVTAITASRVGSQSCVGCSSLYRSQRLHGLASGAAGVCIIRPTTPPAGRAAVLLDYVLRPAGFIGHYNVRLSLNVAGEFRTSKKYCLSLKTSGLRTRTAPLSSDSPIGGRPGMNPSHHGTDEQMFGSKQQFCTGGRATKTSIC
jgi:hypothetical protein